jgi:hypothetical protein
MTDGPTKRPRGRPFEKGNSGRTVGSKNRKTQILGSLSKEDQDRLVRRAYEVAMEGDPTMLKFFRRRHAEGSTHTLGAESLRSVCQ